MTVRGTLAIIGLVWVGGICSAVRAAQEPESMQTVWDGIYTEAQAKRGEALYTLNCASCHGPSLGGGEAASALTGPTFMANWSGVTMGDLFERIRVSMPQDQPGRLSGQQNADVLAYVLSVNKFPAGKMELARQADMLRQIKFEAQKPGSH